MTCHLSRRIVGASLVLLTGVVGVVATPARAATSSQAQSESRCTTQDKVLSCERNTATLSTGLLGLAPRDVHWQIPLGDAPAGGWPAVVVYSPSFFSADISWEVSSDIPFGPVHQTETYKALLDSGYAVITPESHLEGFTFWDTNNPAINYELSPDKRFVDDILAEIPKGTFGQINSGRLFATGMSSGGYMTSRMAVSHAGRFKALSIQSASYATCAGPLCPVPEDLPDDHPPTLFLHGALDPVVPIATMYPYRDALDAQGTQTKTVVDDLKVHEFLPVAPAEIPKWFQQWDPGPNA